MMGDRRATYEAKGGRPRELVGVRLNEEEKANALRLAKEGESVQDVMRRLLNEAAKKGRRRK